MDLRNCFFLAVVLGLILEGVSNDRSRIACSTLVADEKVGRGHAVDEPAQMRDGPDAMEAVQRRRRSCGGDRPGSGILGIGVAACLLTSTIALRRSAWE